MEEKFSVHVADAVIDVWIGIWADIASLLKMAVFSERGWELMGY